MDLYDELITAVCVIVFTIAIIFIFRKLLERRKRKALNDAAASKSGHYWTPIELADHGFYCAECKDNLTTGYECDYCSIKVDTTICMKALASRFLCKTNFIRNDPSGANNHHWVIGNMQEEKFCDICDELVGDGVGLRDYRCSWCTRAVHTKCMKNMPVECDFGEYKSFVFPPRNVEMRKSGHRTQKSPVIMAVEAPQDVSDFHPIIAIVNPKSGSGAGKGVLRKLRNHLHPAQVIDVTKSNMKASLAWMDKYPEMDVRILIAGGDGTISLVLNDIDELEVKRSVAILPLGTGNDLSRVFGWGKEHDGSVDVLQVLKDVSSAKTVSMDRWTINVENNRKLGVRLFNKSLSMTNYVSIGVDACVTLGMQTTRSSIPRAMSSRLINKLLFFTYGTKDVFERACKGLQKNLELYLDNSDIPIELPDIEGLVFLNIPYWGAGVKPWESAPENWKQDLDDRKFEIFAVTSSFHIAQLQVGLSSPIHIGQASKAVLKVKKGPLPMQSDGEAWMQNPASITISFKCTSNMLGKTEQQSVKGFFL